MQPPIVAHQTPEKPKRSLLFYFLCAAGIALLFLVIAVQPTRKEVAASKVAQEKAKEKQRVAILDSTRAAFKAQKENTVTAQALLADYKADKFKADNKYKGRNIYVEGTVDIIDARSRYSGFLTFSEDKFGTSVLCSLEDKKKATHLGPKDYIAVYGMCDGLKEHDIFINNAQVVPTVASWQSMLGEE